MSTHKTFWERFKPRWDNGMPTGTQYRIISDEFEALRILNDAKFAALEARIDFMQREIDSLRVEVASK